ncbi:spore cortex biosynthesis protein YabQ [Effusibacillus dendaii]|uniref:Spore cortex biosynthesis protein YabQ n=1 Tax=Effusibacillus dendaii TaxID=2743772 RepID=A0A7I8DFQ5_9BACL|nr:spore cortex biosynthesis protein YabQ [Effusibacillus dendaii]BCJ87400.1 hypothetical protein skT53_23850 [Effusibacillus dendaii]
MALELQYMTLLAMSLNGILLGAVFDICRVVLRQWKFLRWAKPLFDFSFWIFALFSVFSSLMWANNGELRMYVFVILLLGWVLYRVLLQRIVVGSTVGIIMGIRYICVMLWNIFVTVVVRPVKTGGQILIRLFYAFDRLLKYLERVILWPFRISLRIILWLLRPVFRLLRPITDRLAKRLRPISSRMEHIWGKGKGIWEKLTNWLLNKDDQNPKQ